MQGREHLARLRVVSHLLLGEDKASVCDDVELALLAFDRDGVVPVGLQLGRETRGPLVVARSDRAVENLDLHDTDCRCSGPISDTELQPARPRVRSKSAAKLRITSRTPGSPPSASP